MFFFNKEAEVDTLVDMENQGEVIVTRFSLHVNDMFRTETFNEVDLYIMEQVLTYDYEAHELIDMEDEIATAIGEAFIKNVDKSFIVNSANTHSLYFKSILEEKVKELLNVDSFDFIYQGMSSEPGPNTHVIFDLLNMETE